MNTAITKTDHKNSRMSSWKDLWDIENFFKKGLMRTTFPAINVSEDDKNIMVDVIAPGFKKEDFTLNCNDDILTIDAETKTESRDENKEYSRREYSYNSFTRSFRLPENVKVSDIVAQYSDGVLNLTIPKTESKTKMSKTIPIK